MISLRFNFYRLLKTESYFDILPKPVNRYKASYAKACLCDDKQGESCKDASEYAFPTLLKTAWSPMFLCDRQKRDVQLSDDPSEEEIQLFRKTPNLRHRSRREASNPISKENATRYCSERISESKIGELCEKLGVNVQSLVSVCSIDLEVSYN